MKIAYLPDLHPFHKEIYEINMVCSFDSTGKNFKTNYQFNVNSEDIQKTILEIECISNQFEFGRVSIDNGIYNQIKFFLKDKENFKWLNSYPRDMSEKNNLHLLSYEVIYYDKNQVKQKVEITELNDFLANFKQLNTDSNIGTYFWDGDATKKDYDCYFYNVVHLIDKTILTEMLQSKLEEKKPGSPKKKI